MKRTVVFACALFLVAVLANGQAQIAIGIKGGLNFARVTSSPPVYDKARTGFHAGVFALVRFGKIGIQPEVQFSQQGARSTITYTPPPFTSSYSQTLRSNANYLNIPVLLKVYVVGGINIYAGPQLGVLMSAHADLPNGNGATYTNVKGESKQTDLSAAMGLGWDLSFGLSVDGRYNLGLTKTNNGSDALRNQVIQISVGYKLMKIGR